MSLGFSNLKFITKNHLQENRPNSGADPGFLDRGFKLAEGGSICAV